MKVRKHIADYVNVNLCFPMSQPTSHLAYVSGDVRVKSRNKEQIHVLSYYGCMVDNLPADPLFK